jgi:hypothetical protein
VKIAAVLPTLWLNDLNIAVCGGDNEAIKSLIEQIPLEHPELIHKLMD